MKHLMLRSWFVFVLLFVVVFLFYFFWSYESDTSSGLLYNFNDPLVETVVDHFSLL